MNYKLFLLFIFLINAACLSQADKSIGNDISDFLNVGEDIFSSPTKFDKNDWTNLSLTISLTAASFIVDETVRDFSYSSRNNFLDPLFIYNDNYPLLGMGITIAGLYGYGFAADNSEIKNLGLQLAESVVYASAITLLIKPILGRSRPAEKKGNSDFNPINFSFDKTSFPSLHAASSFAFSNIMAKYFDNIYWKISWYTFASLISTARVYTDLHWFSDIVLGAAIGYFIGEFVSSHSMNKMNIIENPQPINFLNFKIVL